MSTYRQYNMSRNLDYPVSYICEKCGTKNSAVCTRTITSAYTDKGFVPNMEKRKDEATQVLNERYEKAAAQMEDLYKAGKYASLKISCRCSKCKKIPAWAIYDSAITRSIKLLSDGCILVAFFMFLFKVLSWLNNEPDSILPVLLILIFPVLYNLGSALLIVIKNGQCAKMDSRYLPKINWFGSV